MKRNARGQFVKSPTKAKRLNSVTPGARDLASQFGRAGLIPWTMSDRFGYAMDRYGMWIMLIALQAAATMMVASIAPIH